MCARIRCRGSSRTCARTQAAWQQQGMRPNQMAGQQNVRPNQMEGRQNVRPNQMPGMRSAGGAAMAGCRRPQPNQAENDILKRATENVSENDGDELEQQMMAGAHELVNAIDIDSASELMHEVEDLMIMGYQANLPFERDFIAEGVAMLNGYELGYGVHKDTAGQQRGTEGRLQEWKECESRRAGRSIVTLKTDFIRSSQWQHIRRPEKNWSFIRLSTEIIRYMRDRSPCL